MKIKTQDGYYLDLNSRIRVNRNLSTTFDLIEELYTMKVSSKKYYAKVIAGKKKLYRDGSIGEIVDVFIPDVILSFYVNFSNRSVIQKSEVKNNYQGRYHRSDDLSYHEVRDLLSRIKIKLKCDKSHKATDFSLDKIEFLTDYTGECKYVYQKPDKSDEKNIILKDKFDNDITVGSFIVFANSTSRQQGRPKFGKITKITSPNVFYAKNIKLAETDNSRVYVLREPHEVILLTEDLIDQITIARLSF